MSTLQRDADQILRPILQEVLRELQTLSGCQSVGIRLQRGGDYPYYVHEGFPEFFILKENSLCTGSDSALYGSDGDPLLACMCGLVLKGRCEPRFHFFTEDGCFWTNSTTKLLESSTGEEHQLLERTRAMCHRSGYESVALVPLSADEKILGLIQLNDPRAGMFTLDNISKYKAIADKVGGIVRNVTEISEEVSRIREIIEAFKSGVDEERSPR